jgi:hypothetical protein
MIAVLGRCALPVKRSVVIRQRGKERVTTQPCHCKPFFWGKAISEFIRLNEPLGDCFVAKNAPRNDILNSFETGLNSYRNVR